MDDMDSWLPIFDPHVPSAVALVLIHSSDDRTRFVFGVELNPKRCGERLVTLEVASVWKFRGVFFLGRESIRSDRPSLRLRLGAQSNRARITIFDDGYRSVRAL